VEAPASVSTGDNATNARTVEAAVSVSTGEYAVYVRIVEALASVSTGEYAVYVRIVEALASVSTGDDAVDVRIVEALDRALLLWARSRNVRLLLQHEAKLQLRSQLPLKKMNSISTSMRVRHQSYRQHYYR